MLEKKTILNFKLIQLLQPAVARKLLTKVEIFSKIRKKQKLKPYSAKKKTTDSKSKLGAISGKRKGKLIFFIQREMQ